MPEARSYQSNRQPVVKAEPFILGMARWRLTLACGCTVDSTDRFKHARCLKHPVTVTEKEAAPQKQ